MIEFVEVINSVLAFFFPLTVELWPPIKKIIGTVAFKDELQIWIFLEMHPSFGI